MIYQPAPVSMTLNNP